MVTTLHHGHLCYTCTLDHTMIVFFLLYWPPNRTSSQLLKWCWEVRPLIKGATGARAKKVTLVWWKVRGGWLKVRMTLSFSSCCPPLKRVSTLRLPLYKCRFPKLMFYLPAVLFCYSSHWTLSNCIWWKCWSVIYESKEESNAMMTIFQVMGWLCVARMSA